MVVQRQVVRERSVEYMPFLLSLNVLLNATAWTAYSIYSRDVYVLVREGVLHRGSTGIRCRESGNDQLVLTV